MYATRIRRPSTLNGLERRGDGALRVYVCPLPTALMTVAVFGTAMQWTGLGPGGGDAYTLPCQTHLLHFAKQSGGNLLISHKAMPFSAKS